MILAMLVLFIAVIGVSYAAFSYIRTGEKLNAITTDATGKVRLKEGEYFDFTLSTTIQGTTNVNWEIAAQDVTTGSKKIDGKYIKLYLSAKYASTTSTNLTSTTTIAKVGLLRLGELNSGQFDRYGNNTNYWTLTPYNTFNIYFANSGGTTNDYSVVFSNNMRLTINLKSNVVITSGEGTKDNPFEVKLAG